MKSKSLIIVLTFLSIQLNAQEVLFSKEQIQNDIIFLEQQLQKFHPNLYIYTSKEEVNRSFQQLKNSIPDGLSKTQSYTIISSTCSIIKDGHYIVQPDKQTLNQFYTTSKLLPLDIYWIEENAYIIRNYSDTDIERGSKVLSINGIEVNKLRKTILNGALRDGYNKTYPNWILNNFGRAYYNFHFGSSDMYKIKIEEEIEESNTITIKGMNSEEISHARKAKHPVYFQNTKEEKGLDLEINKHTAVMTIKSFENKILKKTYNQKFKKTIRTCFKAIKERGINNLII